MFDVTGVVSAAVPAQSGAEEKKKKILIIRMTLLRAAHLFAHALIHIHCFFHAAFESSSEIPTRESVSRKLRLTIGAFRELDFLFGEKSSRRLRDLEAASVQIKSAEI